MPKMSPMEELGYARAMAVKTGSEHLPPYPTRDKHTEEEESEFVRGFNLGLEDFKRHGYHAAQAYMREKEESCSPPD